MATALRHSVVGTAAALAALTVGLRLVPLLSTAPTAEDGRPRLEQILASQGFSHVPVTDMTGIAVARGDKGYCRVTVAELSPMGWQNDVVAQMASEGDAISFVYGGVPYAEPRTWEARLGYFEDRVRRVLGLQRTPVTPYGVVASSWCRPGELDASALR